VIHLFKNKKLLVTGGAGFIGSNIAEQLALENEVVILDNLFSGSMDNVQLLQRLGVDFINGSVSNTKDVRCAMKDVDYVFHHAAQISVPLSFEEPELTNEYNVKGTRTILAEAERYGVEKIIFASSAAVYGNEAKVPVSEKQVLSPLSPYGSSKVAGEEDCIKQNERGPRSTVLRYFNVFGQRQDPGSEYAAAIPAFIGRVLSGRLPIIYGDGNQTRDFIYVDDVVKANVMAASSKEADGQIINIACGMETSILDLASRIISLSELSGEPLFEPARIGDIDRSYADIEKAKGMLKFSPDHSVDEGLKRTMSWFKEAE